MVGLKCVALNSKRKKKDKRVAFTRRNEEKSYRLARTFAYTTHGKNATTAHSVATGETAANPRYP